MGVQSVLGGAMSWCAENDKAASKILAHHWPDVPNLGDVTKVDWATVPKVDVITGGSPCQDLSHAGKRAGMKAGTRSGLWASMCDAIEIIRPRLVVWENVRGALSAEADSGMEPCPGCVGDLDDGPVLRALGRVLGDLADLGYDASWYGLRAADVGAPHGRFRIFVFATDARGETLGFGTGLRQSKQTRQRWGRPDNDATQALADAGRERHGRGQDGRALGRVDGRDASETRQRERSREVAGDRSPEAATDALSGGRDGRTPDPLRSEVERAVAAGSGEVDWPENKRDSGDRHDGNPVDRERVMGYLDHASDAEDGPDQALRDMRGTDGPQEVRDEAGGSLSVHAPAVLLSGVCEHKDGGGQECASLAGQEVPGRDVLGVPSDQRSARPPHRPEPRERRSDEPSDPLRELPSETPLEGRPSEANGGSQEGAGDGETNWGQYAPAIRRWEMVLGRVAPPPTEAGPKGGQRLSPKFCEWLMGLPGGHVTGVKISRNDMLKALGNGVVPAQAAEATRRLLEGP